MPSVAPADSALCRSCSKGTAAACEPARGRQAAGMLGQRSNLWCITAGPVVQGTGNQELQEPEQDFPSLCPVPSVAVHPSSPGPDASACLQPAARDRRYKGTRSQAGVPPRRLGTVVGPSQAPACCPQLLPRQGHPAIWQAGAPGLLPCTQPSFSPGWRPVGHKSMCVATGAKGAGQPHRAAAATEASVPFSASSSPGKGAPFQALLR